MKPYGLIYLITCLVNGKKYVGQTIKPMRVRWNGHKADAKRGPVRRPFCRALAKYGPEKFSCEILDVARDQGELDFQERFWISKLGTCTPNGYNLAEGGGTTAGVTHGPETRAKMRQARLGKKMSEETKAKIRAAKLGKPMSPEAVEKSRLGHLGRRMTEEAKAKISAAQTGRRHSEETKERIGRAHKGRARSPEEAERLRTEHLRRTPETLEKIRQAALNISDETREKMRQAQQGRKQDPELVRRRIAASLEAKRVKRQRLT